MTRASRLYFLHLPKTAGMTLTDLLDGQYHQQVICRAMFRSSLHEFTARQLAHFQLFRGHLDYGLEAWVGAPLDTITFLRDPLDRIVSFYNHARRPEWQHTVWAFHYELARHASFERYALHPDTRVQLEMRNGQARRLCGAIEETASWSDDRLFATAKAHLESFLIVGVAEAFDRSYRLLCRIMGWSVAAQYASRNVGGGQTKSMDLPEPLRRVLLANNAVDVELMAFARDQLQRQPLAHWAGATVRESPSGDQRIRYQFDQPLPGDGWHGRERSPQYGWFRWTGPSAESTLRFRVRAGESCQLTMTVIAGFRPHQADALTLSIGETALEVERDVEGELMVLRCVIPATLIPTSHLTVRLTVPVAERAGPHDERTIGVAVQQVVIEPLKRKKATMPNERVIEIPWALAQIPQSGIVLDVGSCEATYLHNIPMPDRLLHCLDMRACDVALPAGAVFHQQDFIGNDLARHSYDAVLILSTLEHIGLPHYGMEALPEGDRLALGEAHDLLKPDGVLIVTVPAGRSRIASWYRQYSPDDLRRLFSGWETTIVYWGYVSGRYRPIEESQVHAFDYDYAHGAGAVAGIVAHRRI